MQPSEGDNRSTAPSTNRLSRLAQTVTLVGAGLLASPAEGGSPEEEYAGMIRECITDEEIGGLILTALQDKIQEAQQEAKDEMKEIMAGVLEEQKKLMGPCNYEQREKINAAYDNLNKIHPQIVSAMDEYCARTSDAACSENPNWGSKAPAYVYCAPEDQKRLDDEGEEIVTMGRVVDFPASQEDPGSFVLFPTAFISDCELLSIIFHEETHLVSRTSHEVDEAGAVVKDWIHHWDETALRVCYADDIAHIDIQNPENIQMQLDELELKKGELELQWRETTTEISWKKTLLRLHTRNRKDSKEPLSPPASSETPSE